LAWLYYDLQVACEAGDEDELEELLDDAVALLAIEVKPIELEHRSQMALVYQALRQMANATWADDPPFALTPFVEALAADGDLFYHDVVRVLRMLDGRPRSDLRPAYLDGVLNEVAALDDPERRVLQVLLRRWQRWLGRQGPGPDAAQITARLESRARPVVERQVELMINVQHKGGRARNVRLELRKSDAFDVEGENKKRLGNLLADEAVRRKVTFKVSLRCEPRETLPIEFVCSYDDRVRRGHTLGPMADEIRLLWPSEENS
jgi:hypothetical protein